MKPIRLALVGATGLVGRTTLDVLREWSVPLRSLRLFASDDSAGGKLEWCEQHYELERLDHVPADVDAAIFATSAELSRAWVPRFRERGILVLDHSSAFRMAPDVPLVIPEVNGAALAEHRNLIANPNCTASIIVIPLAAIQRVSQIEIVVADTYQSVSGTGQSALAELESQLGDEKSPPQVYPRHIAHNLFPQIGSFDASGRCDEECKIADELRKMLELPHLTVLTTTVRVPVRVGHAAAVSVFCRRPPARDGLEQALRSMPGMVYEPDSYRTPREIAGRQEVFVGRLRQAVSDQRWVQFWVVGDNLRKGAASNAVQVLMELFRE